MNDKQKWFIVVAVGCIGAIGIATIESNFREIFDVYRWQDGGVSHGWTGCVLFGILCSSITGFFLFKDK